MRMKGAILITALLCLARSDDDPLPRLFLFTHSSSTSHLGFVFRIALKTESKEVYDVRWPMTENVRSYSAPKHFKTVIFERGLSDALKLFEMMDESAWKGGRETIKLIIAVYHVLHLIILPCDFEDTIEYESSSVGTDVPNLALIDGASSWCAVPHARALSADYVFLCPLTEPVGVSFITGSPLPFSYSTSVLVGKAYHEMGFLDRVLNALSQSFFYLYTEQMFFARMVFNDPQRLKFLDDVQTTMLLENSHRFFDWPVPSTRARIRVGSFRNELPSSDIFSKDLSDFLEEDFDGFVVFSMSTYFSDGRMPDHVISVFSEAFSRFPRYGFIWRINELPAQFQRKNIFADKWIPQRKLLGEARVLLLISHCGQNSFLEAVREGVPVLGIPQMGDQYVNAKRLISFGLGAVLNKDELRADIIHRSLTELLINKTRGNRSAAMRKMLLTEEEFGMADEAAWWIRYKLRHNPTSYREWVIPKGHRLGIFVNHGVDILGILFLLLTICSFRV